MARFQLAFILVASLVSWEAVSALQCHSCSYEKYGEEENGNKHCEKPSGDYAKGILRGCSRDKNSVFGCGKVAVTNGKRGSDNSPVSYSVDRGCVSMANTAKIAEGCTEKSVTDWSRGTDEWSRWVTSYTAAYYTSDTKVVACYCTKDECNAASSVTVSIRVLGLVLLSAIGKCLES